jgi:branched-subunit amino acid transport protein
MNEFILIAGMALVTFAIRYPLLALVGKIKLPKPVFEALRYVPPAVLAAIIMPEVFMPNGGPIQISVHNAHLIAGTATAIIMWRSKNLLLTIVLGMGIFLLLRAVL